MSPELIGVASLSLMLLLMFLGIPIAISMAFAGVVGYISIDGPQNAMAMLGVLSYPTIASYTLSVLPAFLLMGEFADVSGMMEDSYRAANTWLGNLPGGLAMASILGAALFSAVSGSSMACAAIMARIALPTLLDYKYSPTLAAGALAAGGTLGNLIPPGMGIIFYCMMTETSIAKLFAACLLPGILLAVMYMVQIYIQCKLNPSLGPAGGKTTGKQKLLAVKDTWVVVLLFTVAIGGLYAGVFTPTEAGALGAIVTFLYAFMRKKLNRQNVAQSFKNAASTSGMAFAIILGAQILTIFVTISGMSIWLMNIVKEYHLSVTGFIVCTMVIYFILGAAMDAISMLFLTLPFFIPICTALGIDLYWFGVLVIIQMELSGITPPVGMNMFVVAAIGKPRGITMGIVFAGVMPFCLTMLVFTVIIVAFPQISLVLLNFMK
jgi:C4-dicarboxylate transporter DctM subunit